MRKLVSLLCLLWVVGLGLQAQQTVFVQGVPRQVAKAPKQTRATAENVFVDLSRIKNFVGDGTKTSVLIVQWNDGRGVENLVWGYKWETSEQGTGEAMLKAVAKADPRLYLLVYGNTQYGSAIGGIGFDLNGNTNLSLNKSGTTFKADAEGVVYTSSYDFDAYTSADPTDHWRSGWSTGFWTYFTADNLSEWPTSSGLGASSRELLNGSVDFWSFGSLEEFRMEPEAASYFYVPKPEMGLYLPDEVTLPISDAGMLPVVLGCNGQTVSYLSWTIQDADGKNDNSIISGIRSSQDAFNGAITFKGNKTGEVYAYLKGKIGTNTTYYQSNTCKIKVVAPERPLTKLAFKNAEMESGIKQTFVNPFVFTPSNASYTAVTYTSTNKEVASVKATGEIVTTATEGEVTITATSVYDPSVTATFKLTVKCQKPVEKIELVKDGVIEIEVKDIYCPVPVITPADADYSELTYQIADPSVASMYQANIVAHKVGETTMTVTAKDGKGAQTVVRLVVKDIDRTPYQGYQDGTFILNEAWFGHENGDMNFITSDKELMYRVYSRENPRQAFGATTCYGMVYADKFFVVSKQPGDGGDTNVGGGRLVVMDAKTLKKIKGFEKVGSGDGRSLVGVNPDKVYVGTTSGVIVFDVKNMQVGEVIAGTQGANAYSGQTGDMVKAGNYVFAIQQSKGTNVIDTENDKLVTCIANKNIQGIVQTSDGNVWLGSTHTLERLNPKTLEIEETLQLPEGAEITCSWGAWRSTPFCASRTKNVLYWAGGTNVMYGGTAYYRYEIGTDLSTLKPFFHIGNMPGATEGKFQTSYGTTRYDDRTDELIVMTTQKGAGTDYEHNWIHLVNGTTGELKKTLKLKQYYWFQSIPVFPDKYAPEVNGVEDALSLQANGEAIVVDLTDKVTDKDNLVCNITKTLKHVSNEAIATATLEGSALTITPKVAGTSTVTLGIESNGVVTEKTIAVTVSNGTGLDNPETGQRIYCKGNALTIEGCEGYVFSLYSYNGQMLNNYRVENNRTTVLLDVPQGLYLLKGSTGQQHVSIKIVVD